MAGTCYLCELGSDYLLQGALKAGEGFGTCYECSVHACPRHGERSTRFFRCADCLAAEGSARVLSQPFEADLVALRGSSPRLSALSADLRGQFDTRRMGAAIRWLRGRVHSDELLLPEAEEKIYSPEGHSAQALGFDEGELSPGVAAEELAMRTALLEVQVRELVGAAPAIEREPETEEELVRLGEIAATSVALAYRAHGAEDPEASPFDIQGGLTLPSPVVALGHAYAVANRHFW